MKEGKNLEKDIRTIYLQSHSLYIHIRKLKQDDKMRHFIAHSDTNMGKVITCRSIIKERNTEDLRGTRDT